MGQSDKMTPYYEKMLTQGLKYQDRILDSLYERGIPLISYCTKKYQDSHGENKNKIEIKNDTLFRKTGNFYIEIAEKSNEENKDWIPSGIYRGDSVYLAIGDDEELFFFAVNQLLALHKSGKFKEIIKKNPCTSKGFLFPVELALKKNYVIDRIKLKK